MGEPAGASPAGGEPPGFRADADERRADARRAAARKAAARRAVARRAAARRADARVARAPAAFRKRPAVLVIRGAGFGHGVGMSQYGARGMALRGISAKAILGHFYSGTRLGRASPDRAIRVLLQAGVAKASFSGAGVVGRRRVSPLVAYDLVAAHGGLELRNGSGERLALLRGPVRVGGPGALTLRGVGINGIDFGRYRGALLVHRAGDRVDVVNELGLDGYVASVIGGEMPSPWPMEALRAQAVAARSYAITTGRGGALYDQLPDTRSQVYRGVIDEDDRTREAARTTAGRVVTYRGRPVATYFFSTSGGLTEDGRYGFPGSAYRPWLRSVRSPWEQASSRHRWTRRMSPAEAGRRLGGLVKGRFRGIRVLRRGKTPRVVQAQVVGTEGDTIVSGLTLKARLGLPDTWAYFAVVG